MFIKQFIDTLLSYLVPYTKLGEPLVLTYFISQFENKYFLQKLSHLKTNMGGAVMVMIYAISAHQHWSCEFESCIGEVYSMQYYVIKFVSDLRQVGFLRALQFPSPK
jgi:hypothetical protein